MKSKDEKRKDCAARVEKWQKLFPEEKLKLIDQRNGVGRGAKKERAKLALLLPKPDPIVVEAVRLLVPQERKATPVIKHGKVILRG